MSILGQAPGAYFVERYKYEKFSALLLKNSHKKQEIRRVL